MIGRVGFKCLFAVVIDRFQLQQDEKREVVVKAGLAAKPHGVTRFGYGGILGVNILLIPWTLFAIKGRGKDGRNACNHGRSLDTL